jgi:hypothetical protein
MPKKPYQKPELVKISLKPMETALAGCKKSGSIAVGGSNCKGPAFPYPACSGGSS